MTPDEIKGFGGVYNPEPFVGWTNPPDLHNLRISDNFGAKIIIRKVMGIGDNNGQVVEPTMANVFYTTGNRIRTTKGAANQGFPFVYQGKYAKFRDRVLKVTRMRKGGERPRVTGVPDGENTAATTARPRAGRCHSEHSCAC